MSIYIQISDKNYKVPNKITIGRGEPFTQFKDNREVARAHLIIARDKKGIYVKDLGSEIGLNINGSKVKPKKYIRVAYSDQIEFAGERLVFLEAAPASFIIVNKFEARPGFWTPQKLFHYLSAFFLLVCGLVGFKLGNIYVGLGIGASMAVFNYIVGYFSLMLVKKMANMEFLTSITYSEDGLTCHYKGGKSMTFNAKAVSLWSTTFNGYGRVLSIQAYGQFHNMQLDKGTKGAIDHLEKVLPGKRRKTSKLQFVLGGTIFAVTFTAFELSSSWYSSNLQLAGQSMFVLLGLASLGTLASPKVLELVMGHQLPLAKQRITVILSAFVFLYVAYDFRNDAQLITSAEPLITDCVAGKTESCQRIDFLALSNSGFFEQVDTACTKGIERACQYSLKRAPASVKKTTP